MGIGQTKKIRFFYNLVILLPFVFWISGCQFPPRIYRINIEEGNHITQARLDKLKKGLTKQEVLNIMGTPMAKNAFRGDRWDYIYRYRTGRTGKIKQKRIILWFKGKKLVSFENKFPLEDEK